MDIREHVQMEGFYKIKASDATNGVLIGLWNFKNLLTKITRDIRVDMLMGNVSGHTIDKLAIKYFAFGDGTTPASINDTKLVNERFRKPVTQTLKTSDTTVQTIVNLLADEANFVIREIGVFCGPAASLTKDTGVLLSRVNVNLDKNSNLILNIVRQDITTI